MSDLFLEMIKSIAAEVNLTSKFKSEFSFLVLMNFHSMNCASKISNPADFSNDRLIPRC